jgi:hypothetical protein
VKAGQRVSMSSIAFDVGVTRQPGAFGEHPRFEFVDQRRDPFLADRKPLLETIDLALDREDRVDAADRFNGEWRFAQIGQLEEVAPTMAPACRLGDRARFALGVIEIAKPGIRIGLEDPGVAGEMPARVLAAAVTAVTEQCCRRVWAGERPVIPDIEPALAKAGVHNRPITVLFLARTGTVVSSPCRRSAANT